MCSPQGVVGHNMQMETKFLRLRTAVEIGSRFGDWEVCWLGGWVKFRLYYLVMLVKVPLRRIPQNLLANRTILPKITFSRRRLRSGF
jgi:hypothetical protein